MKNRLIIIMSIFLLIQFSCTEIPVDVPDFMITDSDRVVLVEELTGVRCPNCPSGAATLEDLLTLYHHQIVVIGVHGDFDTEPLDESKYDFRTEESRAYEDYLKPFWGKPAAAINRVPREGALAQIGINLWGSYINEELEKPHVMNIELETDYDQASRELTINIGFIPVTDLPGNYNYNIALTESHIIDAQLNQSEVIPNYEHNHVFRKMLTAIPGDQLGSSLKANQVINKNVSFTLPEDENLWVPENCHVVVYVSEIEGDNKIAIQAAEANVTE